MGRVRPATRRRLFCLQGTTSGRYFHHPPSRLPRQHEVRSIPGKNGIVRGDDRLGQTVASPFREPLFLQARSEKDRSRANLKVKNTTESSDNGNMQTCSLNPFGRRTISRHLLFLLALRLTASLSSFPGSAWGEAWPVEREWTVEEELAYSKWFEKLASKQWRSTNRMLHDPQFNSLYDEEDREIFFYADCADLPYVIRAYYAFKRRLPFIANEVAGGRYSKTGNRTAATSDNLSFGGAPRKFFSRLDLAHSGNFRTSPEATDSFTYPIAIDRENLRPGTVFYSPNGHVAMVAECLKDGTVKLLDAHPDQSVTRINFGPKLEVRSQTFSGGFRRFRPVELSSGRVAWATDNHQLPGFSKEQYAFENYHEEVKRRLRQTTIDPLVELERYIREDTFQEVLDRVQAVVLGWQVGKAHAIPIPSNIYDAVGDWENFSSPSRDLRLRISMLNIPEKVRYYIDLWDEDPSQLDTGCGSGRELGAALLELKERLFRNLSFQYTNSLGQPVVRTLQDVEGSLFLLSFDPNHAPELRWGESPADATGESPLRERHTAGYEEQQRWRNRLAKKQGAMHLNDPDNPLHPPRHDLSGMIREIVGESGLESDAPIAVSIPSEAPPRTDPPASVIARTNDNQPI